MHQKRGSTALYQHKCEQYEIQTDLFYVHNIALHNFFFRLQGVKIGFFFPWPYLLITALSSISLNTLGLSLPACDNGVTLPISTKPNPIFNNPSTASPCLSKPAANPIGLGNGRPNTVVLWIQIRSCKSIMQVLTQIIVIKHNIS